MAPVVLGDEGNGSPAIVFVFASDSKNLSPQMNFQKGLSVGAFSVSAFFNSASNEFVFLQ